MESFSIIALSICIHDAFDKDTRADIFLELLSKTGCKENQSYGEVVPLLES